MLVVGIMLLLALFYLAQGSAEMFPSEDQEEAVRLAMSVVVVCLAAVEGLLWWLLRFIGRREKPGTGQK